MRMRIYRPGEKTPELREVDVGESKLRMWDKVRDQVEEILGAKRGYAERVSVLFNDQPCDMFAHETGALDGLPENTEATGIYWTASITRGETPEPDWPRIHGTAVLFEGRIWF